MHKDDSIVYSIFGKYYDNKHSFKFLLQNLSEILMYPCALHTGNRHFPPLIACDILVSSVAAAAAEMDQVSSHFLVWRALHIILREAWIWHTVCGHQNLSS